MNLCLRPVLAAPPNEHGEPVPLYFLELRRVLFNVEKQHVEAALAIRDLANRDSGRPVFGPIVDVNAMRRGRPLPGWKRGNRELPLVGYRGKDEDGKRSLRSRLLDRPIET